MPQSVWESCLWVCGLVYRQICDRNRQGRVRPDVLRAGPSSTAHEVGHEQRAPPGVDASLKRAALRQVQLRRVH